MKTWVWIPLVLFVGLLMGSWGPRSEIRNLKDALDAAQKNSRTAASGTARMSGVTSLLGIHNSDTEQAGQAMDTPIVSSNSPSSRTDRVISNVAFDVSQDDSVSDAVSTNAPDSQDAFRKQIEHAAELWRMRSADVFW